MLDRSWAAEVGFMIYTFDLVDRAGQIYGFDLGEFPCDGAAEIAAQRVLEDHKAAESVAVWEEGRNVAWIRRPAGRASPRHA
jgi:hypothetical protein